MCDKFYDSLDEEEDSTPLKKSISESTDISQLVPLFGRETAKSEILRSKTRSRFLKSKPSKLSIPKSNSTSSGSLNHMLLETSKKKSYIDLFHAKIGYVQGSEPTDTTRGICDDDFKTARSSLGSLENSDTKSIYSGGSFISDDSSFYIKFIENEQAIANQLTSISSRSVASKNSESSVNCKLPTLVSLTRSTQSVGTSLKSKSTATIRKVSSTGKFDKSALKVPTLGGLGPDREASKDKWDKLKRQQRYGQKVSNENRMKMLESKVVKNFKFELKKSNELNKCADNVALIS